MITLQLDAPIEHTNFPHIRTKRLRLFVCLVAAEVIRIFSC
jgi:hypothetical protein